MAYPFDLDPTVPTMPLVPESQDQQNLNEINTALGTPDGAERLNESFQRGNEYGSNNQMLLDYHSLTPVEFTARYGERASTLDALDNRNRFRETQRKFGRSAGEALQDTAVGVAEGIHGVFAGASSFGAALLPGGLGDGYLEDQAIRAKINAETFDSFRSPHSLASRNTDKIRKSLDDEDSMRQYQRDIAGGMSTLVAEGRKVARDAAWAGKRIYESDTKAGELLESGVGSILALGPIVKSIIAAAQAAGIGMTTTEAVMLSNGIVEAGSASDQVIGEVLGKSFEDLEKSSEDYRNLLTQGFSPEDARRKVALMAGSAASVYAGIAGFATGGISKIETAPFKAHTTRELFREIGKESLEEAIQNPISQVGQNIGTRLHADNDLLLTEGVGEAFTEGVAGGALSAGALKTPGLVTEKAVAPAIRGTVSGAKAGARLAAGAIDKAAERVKTANEKGSVVNKGNVAEAVELAKSETETVAAAVEQLANQNPEQQAYKTEGADYAQRLRDSADIRPEELDHMPAVIFDNVDWDNAPTRFEFMDQLSSLVLDPNTTEKDVTLAGMTLDQMVSNNRKMFVDGMPTFLAEADPNSSEFQLYKNYETVMRRIEEVSEIQDAIQKGQEALNKLQSKVVEEITNDDVDVINQAATVNPTGLNPEFVKNVLAQNDSGKVTINPRALANLRVVDTLNSMNAAKPEGFTTPTSDIVSRHVREGTSRKDHQYSLGQHIERIMDPMLSNDVNTAKRRLLDLKMFAAHQANKVAAMQKSEELGGGKRTAQKFKSIGDNHRWVEPQFYASQFYSNTPEGHKMAQNVYSEAVDAAMLFNKIQEENPQLASGRPMAIPKPFAFMSKQESLPLPVTEQPVKSPVVDKEVNKTVESTKTIQKETKAETKARQGDLFETEVFKENTEKAIIADEIAEREGKAQRRKAAEQAKQEVVKTDEVVEKVQEKAEEPIQEEPENTLQEDTSDSDTLSDVTKNLPKVGEEKTSFFDKVYRSFKASTTALFTQSRPLQSLQDAVQNPELLGDMANKKGEYYADLPKEMKAFEDIVSYGDKIIANIKNNLREAIKKDPGLKNKLMPYNSDKSRKQSFQWTKGKVLSILDISDKGFKFNDQLLEGAVIAGLDWFMNTHGRFSNLTMDKVKKNFNSDFNGDDLVALTNIVNDGMLFSDAVRDLSRSIEKMWGVRGRNDMDIRNTQGISGAVALEIVRAMAELDFFDIENVQLNTKGNKSQNRILFSEVLPAIQQAYRDAAPVRDLISDLFNVPSENTFVSIGSPIKTVPATQLNNPRVQNSRAQRGVIARTNKIEYQPNTNYADFTDALGKVSFIRLLVGNVNDENLTNKNTWRSVTGKIRGIARSFDGMQDHYAQLRAMAEHEGKDMRDIPTYYASNYTSVARLQLLGGLTPQGDKHVRHMLMPSRTVVDLTTDNQGSQGFWLSIAQGLGVKTENQSNEQSIADARAKLNDPLVAGVVADISTWQLNKDSALPTDLVDRIEQIFGVGGTSTHGLDSLVSLAAYQNAVDAGTLDKFEHHSYLEADGKTNGPINTLMLFSTGVFTPAWNNLVKRGGYMLGQANAALSSLSDKRDLYTLIAEELSRKLNEKYDENNHVLKMASKFLGDITFTSDENGDSVEVGRKFTKNPITISLYGSGIQGISENVANEFLDSFYQAQSDWLVDRNNGSKQSFAEFMGFEDSSFQAHMNDLGLGRFVNNITNKDLTATKEEFEALSGKFFANLVKPLGESIDKVVKSHAEVATKTMQEATQIQSVFQKHFFKAQVVRKLADKLNHPEQYPDFESGDFLSLDELNSIFDSMEAFAPTMTNKYQSFDMATKEGTDLSGTWEFNGTKVHIPLYVVNGLNSDRLGMLMTLMAPAEAGVRAVPSMVIGSGDGLMQLLFASSTKLPNKFLDVYDGLNIPVDMVFDASQEVNNAVFRTWTENNPFEGLFHSYSTFAKMDPIAYVEGLLGEDVDALNAFRLDMSKVIEGRGEPEELHTLDSIGAKISSVLDSVIDTTASIGARQLTLKETPASVDQMASANSPYTNVADGNFAFSEQDRLVQMNERYQEHLATEKARLNEALGRENKSGIDAARQSDIDAINKVSKVDSVSGAKVMSGKDLSTLVQEMGNTLSGLHRDVLQSSAKLLEEKGYQIITGLPSEVDTHIMNNTSWDGVRHDSVTGVTLLDSKKIYLFNPSPETLSHEVIHAAVADKVESFYKDSSSVSEVEAGAIKRIEAIMNEWLSNVRDELGIVLSESSMLDSKTAAYNQIMEAVKSGHIEVAVNEFIAWSLSNQNLASDLRTKKVTNPLGKLVGQALKAIRELIWGKNAAPEIGSDMFSNIRFNARILMRRPDAIESLKQDTQEIAAFQNADFGNSFRLSEIRKKFAENFTHFLKSDPTVKADEAKTDSLENAINVTNLKLAFLNNGFNWDMQQQSTFTQLVGSMMLLGTEKTAAMSKLQSIFDQFMDTVSATDLQDNPTSQHPGDIKIGSDRLNALTGTIKEVYDRKGLSSILPAFLAAAHVDPVIQRELRKMGMPKGERSADGTVDAYVSNLGSSIMDKVSDILSGSLGKENANEAVKDLTEIVMADTTETKSFIEQHVTDRVDTFDKALSDGITVIGDNAVKRTEKMRNSQNTLVKSLGVAVGIAGSLANKDKTAKAAAEAVRAMNATDMLDPVREIMSEVVGRTEDNAEIFDKITPVRGAIHQLRQQYRDYWPAQIDRLFKTPLKKGDWETLGTVIGKTHLTSLIGMSTAAKALDYAINPASNKAEVASLTKEIEALPKGKELVEKSSQLAVYMMTGRQGNFLLRNAYMIAAVVSGSKPDNALVEKIDRLISHKAVEMLQPAEIKVLKDIAKNDREALETLLYNARVFSDAEMAKEASDLAKMNHYKGFIPSQNKKGYDLKVVSSKDHAKLMSMGYSKIADYNGSVADPFKGSMAYYFTPVSGRPTYNQGVLQTAQQTYSGVDATTGYSLSSNIAGRITDPRMVAQITRRMRNNEVTQEPLMPVVDKEGRVIAYERGLNPQHLGLRHSIQELHLNLGAWRGRQMEETLARTYNGALVQNLNDIWKKAKDAGRTDDFVDVSNSTDKIIQDSWNVVPYDTKQALKKAFGEGNGIMIRKDMIVDALGTRSASVGDFWTGNTRFSEANQKRFQNLGMAIAQNNAYRYAVNTEGFIQGLVTTAKVAIVVKSIKVAYSNAMSNLYQLTLQRGVPADTVARDAPKKMEELRAYDRGIKQIFELDIKLNTAEGARDFGQIRKLEARKKVLMDSFKRMSVWPLIEAGEYAAVTEGGISQDDLTIGTGRFGDMIEQALDKTPKGIRTLGRYALMTKDTPVFTALSKAVQYGDFIAKSLYYDDLTKRKGLEPKEAIAKVSEEFVNYNRYAGRWRGYTESMGGTWFWQFKLRSIKVAASIARDNPFRALIQAATPDLPLLNEGDPISDNFISVAQDGRLAYSIGWGMGFRSPSMLPINHLFN